MKIKIKKMDFENVINKKRSKHIIPKKPNIAFRTLLRVASSFDLMATHFKINKIGLEKLPQGEPCLYLMNHSSFIDLKIASVVLYPKPFSIVCTSDGFIGKKWLMRNLGCIPTKKFVTDIALIRDMLYSLKKLKCNVLMYPEAGYSFDGRATVLPNSLGRCLKMLDVPVVMIKTYGAFSRDPLYNNLQLRKVDVSADMEYILSREDIKEKSCGELNEIIQKHFDFDSFKWQQENRIKIDEPFRADCLDRLLYKCPNCKAEGKMLGKGTEIKCHECGKSWTLDEYGYIRANEGVTEFEHIPDWYDWERQCVRDEIDKSEYSLDIDCKILVLTDTKCLYDVGRGHLSHTFDGFHLTGYDNGIDYFQKTGYSYSLNSDFYWYEIGDMISIGNNTILYYCFPENNEKVVTKARLAAEELYKIKRGDERKPSKQ